MARASSSPFVWRALPRKLSAKQRAGVRVAVDAMLRWQRRLRRWPDAVRAPNATPFVSLYARGRLCGCYGSDEGSAGERLGRAFLRALGDTRFGSLAPEERTDLVAQVSYPHSALQLGPSEVLERLEVGVHGVALRARDRAAVLVLPQVARDEGVAPEALLSALSTKAGLEADGWRRARLALFETDDVVVRRSKSPASEPPLDAAARWLDSLIERDGSVIYGLDARRRQRHARGPMHHGRVAMALRALAAHGRSARRLGRARRQLEQSLRRGLRGADVDGWPDHPALVVGTLALACLAGVDLRRELLERLGDGDTLGEHVWHAAQAALALGPSATPAPLWRLCRDDLAQRPWAPWTAMAARERADGEALALAEKALVDSIALGGPHEGGAGITEVPELAQTAVVVEALGSLRSTATRQAMTRARAFLRRWQFLGERIPASLEPSMVHGAFPISPVVDAARCDVTAHALLALLS